MAAHSNDKTFLGNGLNENVRSGNLERVLDFAVMKPATSTYYEIGTLPDGFVPRNIAILQLTPASAAATFKVYKTVEDASDGSAVEIAGITTATSGTMATAFKPFDTIATEVTQSSSSPYAVSAVSATVTPGVGTQLAVGVGSAFTSGRVKVVISGDQMAGVWDEGDKAPPIKPTVAIKKVEFASDANPQG